MGEYGDKVGCRFAIETGPEACRDAAQLSWTASGCKVCASTSDPANLLMVSGDDPVKAVHALAPYIVHTHAKDGRMVKYHDPEIIYDFFADDGITDLRMEDCFTELPLGEGGVDWDNYLKALREIGYDGYLTIEREVGADPARISPWRWVS